jgi:hypothetical protein
MITSKVNKSYTGKDICNAIDVAQNMHYGIDADIGKDEVIDVLLVHIYHLRQTLLSKVGREEYDRLIEGILND